MLVTAIQPNGERIPIEHWVYDAWVCGELNDPFITRFLYNAVEIREGFGWPRIGPEPHYTDRKF